jgi:serine protease
MNIALKSAACALAALVLSSASAAPAAGRSPVMRQALAPAEGEVIVQFKSDAGVMRRHALAARADAAAVDDALNQRAHAMGARLGRTLHAGGAVGRRSQVVRAVGVDAATLARELAADPDVEFAEPNGRKRAFTAPNDPLYAAAATGVRPRGPDSGQWYLRAPAGAVVSAIDIEAAWARTQGSAGVVIAVLDTGVRPDHPDLGGRLLPGYDFVSNATVANDGNGRDADPTDPGDWVTAAEARTSTFSGCSASNSSWHGTSTASLVGASTNDGVGMAGTAPGVRILPVRVLGKCYGTDSDIQAGMLWAAGISVAGVPDNPTPAKVLNMSLGGSGACSASYQSVVDQVLARGAVIVAAAGNSAGGPVGVPGNCRGVISVLALRHVGTKVGFSDLGNEIAIAAPGGNCVNTGSNEPCLYPILAASNTGTQGPLSATWTDSYNISVGTSFSSPLVAGTVGLMFSAQPALTPAQVRSALQATARPFPSLGGDNGSDPTPVTQCVAPNSSVQQLQCYCNTAYCGAGMLNAGAAVAEVAGLVAKITVLSANPTAGTAVQLDSAGSSTASGRSVVAWSWTLVDGGGIASSFSSATNAATAVVTPAAAGSFTVRLTVTDDLGLSASTDLVVSVAASAVTPSATPTAPAATGGSSGGGAMSAGWLLLLASAVLALRRSSGPPRG